MKDWISGRGLLPGWVLSAVFHGALLWLVLSTMPLWNRMPVGEPVEPTREIGIFVKERGELVEPNQTDNPDAVETESAAAAPTGDPLAPRNVVPEMPSVTAALPKTEQFPAIGPGAPLSNDVLPNPKELIRSNGTATGAGGKSSGLPGATFMGVEDHGSRIVYVVDASASMENHHAMGAAKSALVASLHGLETSQQFQIIFYNEIQQVMRLKGGGAKQLHFATDVNKAAARQYMQQITPDGGTGHRDALLLSLSFGPEVMYVLTDSGEPKLKPRELEEIQRKNAGRTHIHCIEFGEGPELISDSANFLKKLAAQNGGTHRYVDVTALSGKRK
jgi:hypothetical protein